MRGVASALRSTRERILEDHGCSRDFSTGAVDTRERERFHHRRSIECGAGIEKSMRGLARLQCRDEPIDLRGRRVDIGGDAQPANFRRTRIVGHGLRKDSVALAKSLLQIVA